MPNPILSICVPTYNRARYLKTLLATLVRQLASFPHAFEIVISDNASTDETQEVIAAYEPLLPIRKYRHEQNLGAFANWSFVIAEARGELVMYLADDDTVIPGALAAAVSRLLAMPQVGVAYAPWLLIDVPTGKVHGQFYSIPETFPVAQGDFKTLLDVVLRHRIWPEISIVRRSLLRATMLHIPDTAYCFFVHAGEYLGRSTVLFLKDPFYVSITRHFEGDQRAQAGNAEVQHAWDRYRGGLEYLLARALRSGISEDARKDYLVRISAFIAERIGVAVRLRQHAGQSPTEIYSLALRAVALGAEAALPEPLHGIRARAGLHFLATDAQLHLRRKRLVCVGGEHDAASRELLAGWCAGSVDFVQTAPALGALTDAVVYVGADQRAALAFTDDELAGANARIVHEADLKAKFFW